MKRLFGLCLICLLVFTFVGCQKEAPKSQDTSSVVSVLLDDSEVGNEYQFVKDIVILFPQDDCSMGMKIAHNTTVEEFFSAIVVKDGYQLAVVDSEGNKMENSQIITFGDSFHVIDKHTSQNVFSYTFKTVDAGEIQQYYENQK